MNRLLLDSSAYIDMTLGDRHVAALLAEARFVYMSVITLGELLAGFPPGTQWEADRSVLDAFLKARQVRLLNVDEETASRYAMLFNHAKQRGRMVPTGDLWIAATAVQHKLSILTTDRHFTDLPVVCCLLE